MSEARIFPESLIEAEQTVPFSEVKRAVDIGVGEVTEQLIQNDGIRPFDVLVGLQERVRELGMRPGDVQLSMATASGLKGEATVRVGQDPQRGARPRNSLLEGVPGKYGITLAAVLLMGACDRPKGAHESLEGQDTATINADDSDGVDTSDTRLDTSDSEEEVDSSDTGRDDTVASYSPEDIVGSDTNGIECNPDPYFDPNAEYMPPEQVAEIHAPECGVKPDHAPDECGQQQWLGYSENNPVAVSWMAIANTGSEACTVTITRLELSYKSTAGEDVLLDCGINWSQRLSDGTKDEYGNWGTYISDSGSNTVFDIPPHTGAYIHPFGNLVLVPDDAAELSITFSAEITKGCVASGGMDTYSEMANPDAVDHNIIYEALKTPWVAETVYPDHPISYSIQHVPTQGMDTGSSADTGE